MSSGARGKPGEFHEILAAAKFSHNALRNRLELLVDQRAILRSKHPVEGRGRPRFVYSVPVGKGGAPAVIPNPLTGVVSLSFSRLSQFCRFEKGGFCKIVRGQCNAQICPQIR